MSNSILCQGESIKEILRRNSNSNYLESDPSQVKMRATLGDLLDTTKLDTKSAVNIEMPNFQPYNTSHNVSKEYTREDVTTEKADLRSSINKQYEVSSKSNSNPPEPEIIDNFPVMTPVINYAKRPNAFYELCNIEEQSQQSETINVLYTAQKPNILSALNALDGMHFL